MWQACPTAADAATTISLPCAKGGGTACRDGGIVNFDFRDNNPSVTFGDSSLCTREPSAAAGLFNGKSLFGTTSLAGGFRKPNNGLLHLNATTHFRLSKNAHQAKAKMCVFALLGIKIVKIANK